MTRFEVLSNNRYKTVSCYGSEYLYTHSIFRCTPKRFYFQVLLYPFKEQFYCPSVFIEQGNLGSRYIHVVGQEDKCPFGFTVVELYSTYLLGIVPRGIIAGEFSDLVTQDRSEEHTSELQSR